MERLGCFATIIAYIMIVASSVILFLVLANLYGFEEPLKLFAFIVIWLISSSIASVLLLLAFYRIDDWITDSIDKKIQNGIKRFPD